MLRLPSIKMLSIFFHLFNPGDPFERIQGVAIISFYLPHFLSKLTNLQYTALHLSYASILSIDSNN